MLADLPGGGQHAVRPARRQTARALFAKTAKWVELPWRARLEALRSPTRAAAPEPIKRTHTMPELPSETAQIRQLDSGYSRETRLLLYQAYRQEPSFAYLFESGRAGYEQRVRA